MPKKKEKKERPSKSELAARKEVLLLWAILGEGGGKEVSRPALENKGMLLSDDKAAREGLEKRGLIKVGKGERGSKTLSVTAPGFAWAEQNLAAMPALAQAAGPVLQAWLRRLSLYLSAHDVPLASILGSDVGPSRETRTEPTPDHESIRSRVRNAYLDLTGGRLNTRALLSQLRSKLQDIDRPSLDDALKRMQRDEEASLYKLDNQAEITDADRDAAIYFGDDPRHILWIER